MECVLAGYVGIGNYSQTMNVRTSPRSNSVASVLFLCYPIGHERHTSI